MTSATYRRMEKEALQVLSSGMNEYGRQPTQTQIDVAFRTLEMLKTTAVINDDEGEE